MLYKENWDEAKEMFKAYFQQQNEKRPLVTLTATKGKKVGSQVFAGVVPGTSHEDHWLYAQNIIDRNVNYFENTYFAAESIPYININLGPGVTAAYLGCPAKLMDFTVWFDHIINDWGKDSFDFDEQNFWWKKTKELTEAACIAGKGKFLTGITDLSGVLDIMAHMRGTQEFIYDLVDEPELVMEASAKIQRLWFKYFDELCNITRNYQEGTIDWLSVWSPGTSHTLQCDFAAMLSPNQVEEYYLPELQDQCKRLDNSIFHLDGPDCVKHLDLLLEVPELNAIQWQPGAGQPPAVEWMDVLKKIQYKGKSIVMDAELKSVEYILENLSPKGLFINTYDRFDSPQEAEDYIKYIEKLCVNKYNK